MRYIGKGSKFGGPHDKVMINDTGLAFYEPWEADLRQDLFTPQTIDLYDPVKYPKQRTWQRLRFKEAFYIALNVPLHIPRSIIHLSRWRIANFRTGVYVIAHLVDRGPSAKGRLVDASDAILDEINVQTDIDDIEVLEYTKFGIPVDLYKAAA